MTNIYGDTNMNPDKWTGYNSDEDRRHQEDIQAIWEYATKRLQEGLANHEQEELQRTPYDPVKPFHSDAEADEFHAEVERFLNGEAA